MTISKLFMIGAVALALGFTACSSDDDITSSTGEKEANTNVSVTLSMSLSGNQNSTKAAGLPEDYNYLDEWAGKDKIEKIAIYLVDGTTVTMKPFTVGTDYLLTKNGNQVVLTPQTSAAIKTSAGIKKVYVLVNGTSDVEAALAATPADAFENAYKTLALTLANSGTDLAVSTSAEKLAKKNGIVDETIVMTNTAEITINVAPNITEVQTISGGQNRASVNVERAVARVMVTTENDTYDIKSGATTLGTVSDITWVVAQGENSLFVQRKADFATPNFGWSPATDAAYISNAGSKYDYSGLFEAYDPATQFGGTTVPTMADYNTDPKGTVTADLDAQLSGKFILPNTHTIGVAEASNYKKGNTAYVLVRAKFTPSVFIDGGSYTAGDDFYVGANGRFYISSDNAVDPAKGGVVGQTVAKYVGGKILYYAWVNPDNVPNWYNSPVVRNNVYHVHITGFKNLGTNWNPLYPEDPNSPTPTNPDPKPNVPGVTEPENPIDPTDPLTSPETWMSVDVTVLPWTLHSYKVDLGI